MNHIPFTNIMLIISCAMLPNIINSHPFNAVIESDAPTPEQTVNWLCEYCPKITEFTGNISINFAGLSDDAYYFSNHSGIEKNKPVYLSNQLTYQNQQGQYAQLDIDKLALDSLTLAAKGGHYGNYQLAFDYQKIPLRKYHQLSTPFSLKDNYLQLPDNWQSLETVSTPAELDTSKWQTFNNAIDWQKLSLNWRYFSDENIDYSLNYRRLEKSGRQQYAAAQLINASYLPLPIDQQTEQLEGNISYYQHGLLINLGYFVSHFTNNYQSYFYDNPFSNYVAGSETGELSAEPDNKAYKVKFDLSYRPDIATAFKLYAAVGNMQQNNALLRYSNNALLNQDLPTRDFNATIDTKDFSFRLYNRWSKSLKFIAKYQYKQRDNNSKLYYFSPIITETFIGDSVQNVPYDFTKEQWQLDANWQFYQRQKASISVKKNTTTRNAIRHYQNTEHGIIGKLQLQDQSNRHYSIKASHFKRDAEKQPTDSLLTVSQNPLLYRYNTAERIEDKASVNIATSLTPQLSASINSDVGKRRYQNSALGLQQDNRYHYGADISWQFKQHASMALFYQREKIDATSKGGKTLSYWTTKHQDDITNLGITIKVNQLLDNKASLSIEALNSNGKSQRKMITSASDQLPDVTNLWRRLTVNFSYQISPQLSSELTYQHEKLSADDFAIDTLELKTGDNLLTFGALTPNYNVNYASMKLTYNF
ncbi:membrane protein [Thalassotalea insulae]|uniref:Membrane protein n=1 Tax=Thalassotalea insulae TaxID=2056778 RepID=A0ABQ6GU97_9GAMM|nr:MtrB/PioB family decaheme-associated outer membrane protein [Thalassotalea insulae]GLX79498.1 membrane protein [Thalassotalea insulae]